MGKGEVASQGMTTSSSSLITRLDILEAWLENCEVSRLEPS